MNSFLAVVFAACVVGAYGVGEVNYKNLVPKSQCSSSLGSRIVGGQKAPEGAFPYQVSLRRYGRHFCGGSIINDQWILTAGYCLRGLRDDEVQVYAGSNKLYGQGDVYQSWKVFVHKGYRDFNFVNNIGLIKLTQTIQYKKSVQPIPLPTFNIYKYNYPAVVSGWGNLSNKGETTEDLQNLATCLIDQNVCKEKIPVNIVPENICAFIRYGKGICTGDFGSPLVSDGTLVGIVSYSIYFCAFGYPDVYTRVYSYIDWINEIVNNFLIFAVLLATFLATAYGQTLNYKNLVPESQCSTGLGSRIVGGKTAEPGFFPYQVSLRKYGNHFCGGAIIDEKFILTAAHCLRGSYDDEIEVYVGSIELHGDGATYQSEKVVYHENYSASAISNDIGIIKLSKSIEFNNYTAAIALPSSNILKNQYPAIVSGWGRLYNGGGVPEKLQYLATCLLDHETCNEKAPSSVSEEQICAFTRYSQGACNGDSGGPLVADSSLVGVVSYAFYACAYGYPDVYTRIYSYLDWIHEKMNSL